MKRKRKPTNLLSGKGGVLLFSLLLFISNVSASNYINYYGISMTDVEYNNLINLGFLEDEIYYMTEDTFEANKDIESTLVARDYKYYKTVYTGLDGESYSTEITKSEYENQTMIDTYATVTTSYKTMVTNISQNASGSFRYKVSVAWNKIPSTRSYDIIGIGFLDARIEITSLINFSYTYCWSDASCTTSGLYYDIKNTSTGAAKVYKLPEGDIRSLCAVLYYDVNKTDAYASTTIKGLTMFGDYAHAKSNISSGYGNYLINNNGIQLYSSISNYYDEIPAAESNWTGTW